MLQKVTSFSRSGLRSWIGASSNRKYCSGSSPTDAGKKPNQSDAEFLAFTKTIEDMGNIPSKEDPAYSSWEKKYDELKNDRDMKHVLDGKEVLKKQSDSFVKDYTPLYEHFEKHSTRDYWSRQFYQLPAKEQAALEDFKTRSITMNLDLLKQHGTALTPTLARMAMVSKIATSESTAPVRVAITGASGQIGYQMLFRIASGNMFGQKTPVILHLLELPQAMEALKGVVMELEDCSFPLLKGIVATDNPDQAFSGVDYAVLVGAQPRTKGMERGDLLLKNAEIFAEQGKALNNFGNGDQTRVLVVGNPANTNALIASANAPKIPAENFAAMTMLDHKRGLGMLANKLGCSVNNISRFVIWGNHSATQFPDISHALKFGTTKQEPELLTDLITDTRWVDETFVPAVQQRVSILLTFPIRGAAIISARGSSSAASAANAAIENVFQWHTGTNGLWTSAAVASKGEYGVDAGLFYSFPVVYNSEGQYDVVKDLPITESSAVRMNATLNELLQERDAVSKLLPN